MVLEERICVDDGRRIFEREGDGVVILDFLGSLTISKIFFTSSPTFLEKM